LIVGLMGVAKRMESSGVSYHLKTKRGSESI
jgi:hypothetical protein